MSHKGFPYCALGSSPIVIRHSQRYIQGIPKPHWVFRWIDPNRRIVMLNWTITFLIIALVAALLGFTGIAGAAAGIAKILFVIFLAIFVLSLLFGRRGSI